MINVQYMGTLEPHTNNGSKGPGHYQQGPCNINFLLKGRKRVGDSGERRERESKPMYMLYLGL